MLAIGWVRNPNGASTPAGPTPTPGFGAVLVTSRTGSNGRDRRPKGNRQLPKAEDGRRSSKRMKPGLVLPDLRARRGMRKEVREKGDCVDVQPRTPESVFIKRKE